MQEAEKFFEKGFDVACSQYGFSVPAGVAKPQRMWEYIAIQNPGMQTQTLDALQRITIHGSFYLRLVFRHYAIIHLE
jgi:hypothetical protein